ncbi:MAG: calcium-binding protein, partial [Cyanobacteria bacterium J06642_11]
AGTFDHTTVFNGDVGIDTINAAAVDSDIYLDLTTGGGVIDGVAVTVTGIENVYTGDGDDVIIGDLANNQLVGMRGNDRIDGEAGDDDLIGGAGDDLLYGGIGNDVLNGTNYLAQGAGERDILFSGEPSDSDIFVLGERQNDEGRVFYATAGDNDYAVIKDFEVPGLARNMSDMIQLLGSADNYSIADVNIDGIIGAGIQFNDDVIGIVEGVNASSLNLVNTAQFAYV